MANANANLLQVTTSPAGNSVGAVSRSSKNVQLTAKNSGEGKFSAVLDKATAQVTPQEQPRVQAAETAAEVQPADLEKAVVPQGQSETAQDAQQPAIISKFIPQPTVENLTPEILVQPTVKKSAPEIPVQPTVENLTP